MTSVPVSITAEARDDSFDVSPLAGRISAAMETIMIALLAFMPLALGVVSAWSEMVVVGAVAALVALLVARLIVSPNVRFVWTWAYIPIAIFAMVA
ncbi:MAG: hypothetical protein HN350_19315, partial [Phycisphaerales bacterium]|nr:hypothetical protein [Phycisphaerales bacterium]